MAYYFNKYQVVSTDFLFFYFFNVTKRRKAVHFPSMHIQKSNGGLQGFFVIYVSCLSCCFVFSTL